ncbi:uncharacterized protein LOC135846286 isoform X1 [Planococcus citri]|uniref:uncharacterized protein LOC135846286 isoform X1 n=1 Tax=Planococcus citri TaxID=170843 RepID=UPI0031F72623
MLRIQKVKFCGFECSLRTGTLIVLTIDLVFRERRDYLEYLKNQFQHRYEYHQNSYSSISGIVFLIAGCSLIAAFCGALKNQSLLLIPYVVVKLYYEVCWKILMLPTYSKILDESVSCANLFLFIQAFSFIEWSVTVLGLYGITKKKPALQIPYLVVEMLNSIFCILAIFVIPIVLYTSEDFILLLQLHERISGPVLIENDIVNGILFGIFYVKFNIVLSYYKEYRSEYRILDTEFTISKY